MLWHQVRNTPARVFSWVWPVVVVSALSGCGSDTSPSGLCLSSGPIAVIITVRDSLSGKALADSATGTLEVAGVDEMLQAVDSLRMIGGDRRGTYSVTVDRAGYVPWTKANVQVTERGDCGNPIPVRLSANLQPEMP